ncbi:MAG: hypothetical protein QM578_09520 [Pantoea sp.]|uniref:hypothetical protein n=1 Tax=Pantoea sp. TaxID=69393 RepID=UPI0039E40C53
MVTRRASNAHPSIDSRASGFFVPATMNKRLRAHYARHQPFYEVAAIAAVWILLLIAALTAELYLR